jgi:cysteine desulfurase/selenocysteine lyase
MKDVRSDFPILMELVNGYPLVYCDNASTTHKPYAMLDAVRDFYTKNYANTYRGIYPHGEMATQLYEDARQTVAHFLNARSANEIIFTSGTTEGINFVATAWARATLKPGDEIIITALEHHANWLPWQSLIKTNGVVLKIIPLRSDGSLDMYAAERLITSRTQLVAVTQVSNAIPIDVPLALLSTYARAVGARLLIDAAQSVPHMMVDVQKMNPDFLVFSGHKMGGPTGIGVLYIASELHDILQPYQFGGGMVFNVGQTSSQWLTSPHKFEAGTPPIAQAIGLGAAIHYLQKTTSPVELQAHTAQLCKRLIEGLSLLPDIRILGNIGYAQSKGHLVSFVHATIHAHDLAAYLGQWGICVRAGHHCAQPLATVLGYAASVRVSFYLYNTSDDVDALLKQLAALQNQNSGLKL